MIKNTQGKDKWNPFKCYWLADLCYNSTFSDCHDHYIWKVTRVYFFFHMRWIVKIFGHSALTPSLLFKYILIVKPAFNYCFDAVEISIKQSTFVEDLHNMLFEEALLKY